MYHSKDILQQTLYVLTQWASIWQMREKVHAWTSLIYSYYNIYIIMLRYMQKLSLGKSQFSSKYTP